MPTLTYSVTESTLNSIANSIKPLRAINDKNYYYLARSDNKTNSII